MRSTLVCAAVLAMLSVSASAYAQQPDQPQQPPVNEDKVKEPKAAVDKAPPPPPVPSTQIGAQPAGDSLAAAARKARDAKKDQSQAGTAHVFDNDSIPKQGGVSSVGAAEDASAAGSDGSASDGAAAPAGSATPAENGEKAWRDRFAKLRAKLQQDEDALSIMQRELGVLDVQYYNDPNKALQQNREDRRRQTGGGSGQASHFRRGRRAAQIRRRYRLVALEAVDDGTGPTGRR